MAEDYSSHHEYVEWVKEDADKRQLAIEQALRAAFAEFIERREVEVVVFSSMSAFDLAKAITVEPRILKPLLACCNIAARAIERDLDIRNLDTYSPSFKDDYAKVIAGYVKPFLPAYLELPVLSQVDRVYYIDKEIRKGKGRWEILVRQTLTRNAKIPFAKRMFEAGNEKFEIDAATPSEGPIEIGIDIKRIEARRDIHKRCDEIVNKATKFKTTFPGARFGAVIYYPFLDEHVNIQNRLRSSDVDGVVFASKSAESVENAVKMLLSAWGRKR